jgi:pimeloyl-ACP methyl ester carboxylesterase
MNSFAARLGLVSFLLLPLGSAQAGHLLRWEEIASIPSGLEVSGLFERLLEPGLAPTAPAVTEGAFTQKLSPADPSDTRTFTQRYFLSSAYASGPGAPVIYYICGEAECAPTFVTRQVGELAKAMGAHQIALEHRYYGKSQPFADYTVEHLQYLRTDNALADLAAFQRYAMTQLGLGGKWIVIGGSYAGALSAYYRLQHPELVVGSLASSAPVEARNAFEEFDYHATVVAGTACADAVRSVIAKADAALDDAQALAALKKQFGAEDITDPDDFVYLLSDLAAESMQYGKRQDLCTRLLAGGDVTANYAAYVKDFLGWFGATAVSFVAQGGLDLPATPDNNARPWFYQSCAEYGYWQNAYHDPQFSMRSPRINAAYHANLCKRLFGMEEADDAAMNATHYSRLLDPAQASRIFFTNGSEDPWSELSISAVRGNDHNASTPVQWIVGGSHCSDLRASSAGDSDSLISARQHFAQLVSDWLK